MEKHRREIPRKDEEEKEKKTELSEDEQEDESDEEEVSLNILPLLKYDSSMFFFLSIYVSIYLSICVINAFIYLFMLHFTFPTVDMMETFNLFSMYPLSMFLPPESCYY